MKIVSGPDAFLHPWRSGKNAAGPETSKQTTPSSPLSPPVELYDSIPVTPLGQKQRHSLDLVAGELASAAKVGHMVVT